MILAIHVNRDSYGSDPWVVSVLPPALLTSLRDQPAYSVVVMTLTNGVLDSQEFRLMVGPEGDGYAWTLLSGRMATSAAHNGMFHGSHDSEEEAVASAVQRAVQIATGQSSPEHQPGAGFA